MKRNSQNNLASLLALTLCAAALPATGCRLFIYDDPYGPPPPPEPVYYVPQPAPAPHYAPPPGVYLYTPEPYYEGPRPGLDISIRGQAPAEDDFPQIETDFPSADDSLAAPDSSELPSFINEGTSVAEPVGQYETISADEDFRPQPKRESLAERESAEEKVRDEYDSWMQKRKKQRAEANGKTPRFLQPIPNDGEEILARSVPKEETGDASFMRTVTGRDLSLMQDDEEYRRDLYEWEKETPPPIDWSKYALSIDTIRAWFGLGPDEKAALEYMRQACLKQREYDKTKDRKQLREAALLYEKAVERWPGPATRPDEARKNPFKTPKSGTLIEEDGLFFAGECWFFYHDYFRAMKCYKALLGTYTASIYKDKAARRLFVIGSHWMKCSEESGENVEERNKPTLTFRRAREAYEAIFLNDVSDSGLAPEALYALANGYMRRGVKQGDGSFEEAAFYYKQVYMNYPGHKRAESASRLAMIALHRSYQGPFYDAQPLDEARELAETIIRSGRGNTEVAYEELENIKDEQAKRLYLLGQYYERRGLWASARSCYNRLVKEHPNSGYATEAARAYGEIESKPAESDQLAWIRPVAPFLPKFEKEFFEEAPDAKMAQIAGREDRLDKIGERDYQTEIATAARDSETKTADASENRKLR